jgi:hypothetical protein
MIFLHKKQQIMKHIQLFENYLNEAAKFNV